MKQTVTKSVVSQLRDDFFPPKTVLLACGVLAEFGVPAVHSFLAFFSPFRLWYLNGDYLVLLVSFVLILPLSLLRNLGERTHF